MEKLRIAIFCATEFSIPPGKNMKDIYAPLWLTHYISEGLVKRGHKVTLFASSDSKTTARLESDNLRSLASSGRLSDFYVPISEIKHENFYQELLARKGIIENHDYLLISKLYQEALKGKFDVLYFSMIGLRPLPFAPLARAPSVFTVHSPVGEFYKHVFGEYKKRHKNMHFIGISRSQIKPARNLFSKVIYNGTNTKKFSFNSDRGRYLITGGRISKEKGVSEAIRVAKMTDERLIIVGRHTDDEYWHKDVKPLIGGKIEYRGFVSYHKVPELYQKAKAYLFPVQWEEPFGLVMTESMACGTPIVAFRRGSVPEIVKDGKTGFIVDTVGQMAVAVKKINQIDRMDCRKHVEQNFSVEKMVSEYEKFFLSVAGK